MNFIKELYYGNIRPWERRIKDGSEHKRALKSFVENESILLNSLTGDDLTAFKNIEKAVDDIAVCTSVENFELGFMLGVQLMADCFKGEAAE